MTPAAIDIIIPVYNSKEYLGGMVDSIQTQTFRDFSVIFVDDGSTDGTVEYLKTRLEEVTFPFRILQQKNSGPSAARNNGLRHATAQWIVFCDSDDVLTPEYLGYLYEAVTQADAQMGFCRMHTIAPGASDDRPPVASLALEAISPEQAMQRHYSNWIAPFCLILRRDWLAENRLQFDEECRYCEDLIFITDAIAAARRVAAVEQELYHYYIRATSLLRTNNTGKYRQGLAAFERLEERMAQNPSEAAKCFCRMGKARFVMATLRRAALEAPGYREFHAFAQSLKDERWQSQVRELPHKWRIANAMLQLSHRLFYSSVRMLFSD